jgi:hypothetical protein
MNRIKKQKLATRSVIAIVSFVMVAANFAAAANPARIIPDGKVSIIRDGKVIGPAGYGLLFAARDLTALTNQHPARRREHSRVFCDRQRAKRLCEGYRW